MLKPKKIAKIPVPLCVVLFFSLFIFLFALTDPAYAEDDPHEPIDETTTEYAPPEETTTIMPIPTDTDISETPPDTEEPPVTDVSEDPTDTEPPVIDPPEMRLGFYETYLETGQGIQLQASVINLPGENPEISFYSSDTSVVRVDYSGYIIAVGEGRASVTAYYGDISASAVINVIKPAVVPEYIVIAQSSFNLKIGASAQIEAELLPAEIASAYPLSYSSGNTEVASVDENGLITALKEGEAYITVSSAGLSETVYVYVSSDIEYDTARLDGYLYSSSGKPMSGSHIMIGSLTAVTDSRGYFVFEQVEQREITIKLADDNSAACNINISGDITVYLLYKDGSLTRLSSYDELAGQLPISSVSFDSRFNSIVLSVGEVDSLTYQYEPKDAIVTEIKYTSSNTIVAQVGQVDGVITAKSPGEAIITISLNGGQAEAVCTVTVNPKESTEYSVLIAVIESLVFAALITVFVLKYKSYRNKTEREYDETEDDEDELHDIE